MFSISRISRYCSPAITEQMLQKTAKKARELHCPVTAIKMAQLFRRAERDPCHTKEMYWLCEASRYSNGQGIGKLIDLDRFLKGIQLIDETAMTHPHGREVVDALHGIDSVNELQCLFSSGMVENTEGIGEFLKTTHKIKTLKLGGHWNRSLLDDVTISPITRALSKNTSVTSVDAWSDISDRGALELTTAIASNRFSAVQFLDFFSCPISPKGQAVCRKELEEQGLEGKLRMRLPWG